MQQVGFLIRQEGTEGVYLRRMHILPAMWFQGLQQAVGAQALDMVVAAVRFIPADDTLAQKGKTGDAAVGGVDVVAYLPNFGYFHFNVTHTLTFIDNNTYHTANNKQQ